MTNRDFSGGIKALAPNFNPVIDIAQGHVIVSADEHGVISIVKWDEDRLGPKPTVAALTAAAEVAFTEKANPVPETISDRQFAQALAVVGLISQAEALAWVKVGTVPPTLQTFVDAIPDAGVKFSANMLLGGATEFNRAHPLVAQFGASINMSQKQIDDIWRLGATL